MPEPTVSRAVDVDVAALEQVAAAGWPSLEQERLGDWLLRAAGGFTGRANSVLPLGSPDCPLDDALQRVVDWYATRSIQPRFQVPLPLRSDLDAVLDDHGWFGYDPVRVLVADVDAVLASAQRSPHAPPPDVTSAPGDDWLAAYHYRGQPLPPIARQVMAGGTDPLFVSLADDDGVVAVARGAVDAGWLGVTAVEVVERARRRRLGVTLMHDLLAVGRARGARFTYLQVAEDNLPARTLYDRLGYEDHHGYQYRCWSA